MSYNFVRIWPKVIINKPVSDLSEFGKLILILGYFWSYVNRYSRDSDLLMSSYSSKDLKVNERI